MESTIGKIFILVGIILLIGGALLLTGKLPFIGKLPGDFVLRRDNITIYFPLATSIVLSIILTFLFSIFRR